MQIKKKLVSQNVINKRSYGYGNPVNYITIHQTGNTNKGANAQAHANIQSKLNQRSASWHYQVDDKEAIQSFEDGVKCWHATDGKGPGNTTSVAIEICINSDGDYKKAVENAAELTKYLMDKHNLSIKDIKQHHDWYNKNCPAQLRAGYKGITWSDFLGMVQGVKVVEALKTEVKGEVIKNPKINYIGKFQEWLNKVYKAGLVVDGIYGPKTKKAAIKALQTELNKQFNARLVVDGIWGPKTRAAVQSIRKGARGNIVYILQGLLYCNGYDPKGFDGIFGDDTASAVLALQKARKIAQDAIAGQNTFAELVA
ncbi:peptidoglycan-binding protein [Robertmurraya massiliosenegalensis]|uniref:peptidoglycan recognition protein family protein n=1 Tax=Robertmurraya TaxID=2837507 RepID=UPI0039A78444